MIHRNSLRSLALLPLFFLSVSTAALAAGEQCTPPGVQVITDPAGDQDGGPVANGSFDILSVSIAEPAHQPGKRLLAVTMKVTSLATLPPNGFWWVHLYVGGGDFFTSMRTPDPSAASQAPVFEHGSVTSGSFSIDGAAQPESSYNADGTITVIVTTADIGGPSDGASFEVSAEAGPYGGTLDVPLLTNPVDSTATPNPTYTMGKDAACGLLAGPPTVTQLPPTGIAPRFFAENAPVGLGDNGQGEFNIGFNPATKRLMTLGSTQTLRVTLPEYLTPAAPEVCDALWEDKSDTLTGANTNDPILWTDQATGRTFVSQLILGAAGESVFAYTDDDGDTWSHAPSTIDGAFDHQTVASGPYAAGGAPTGAYPNAVYYCSQQDVFDTCIRSDDGGLTFGVPSKVYDDVTDCPGETNGQHGHLKVAPDGTVYLPRRACAGTQVVSVSEDNGTTWTVNHIPNSESFQGSDPSIGMASDGTTYFCYANASGSVHVQVSKDHGKTWANDYDISSGVGAKRAIFPEAVAGDPDRAACGFIGTDTAGNYQAADFPGIWYLYIAMTYDGGKTWHTVKVSDDPIQGAGGVCTQGTTCGTNRNLLDFNEVTMDNLGRVMFGFDDGCTGSCPVDPTKINEVAKSSIARQIGGRTLLAAFDHAEPTAPKASCLAGTRIKTSATLAWRAPDTGGAAITGYSIYRGEMPQGLQQIATTGVVNTYTDSSANPTTKYYYAVKAMNASGTGPESNVLPLDPSDVVPESPCILPGVTLYTDPAGDGTAPQPASQDLLAAYIAEPADMPGKLVITMVVGAFTGGQPPPSTRWVTYFSPPDGNSYYMSMDTGTGTPAFSYGTVQTVSAPAASVGTFNKIGSLDPASGFSADGTITLIIDEANIGSPAPGSLLGSIHTSVRTMSADAASGPGLTLDGSSQGLYYFRGECGAGPVVPGVPVTGTSGSTSKGRFGGALGGSLLLVLAGLGGLRRRRKF